MAHRCASARITLTALLPDVACPLLGLNLPARMPAHLPSARALAWFSSRSGPASAAPVKPNAACDSHPTSGAAQAATAPSKLRSNANTKLRFDGGTISARDGIQKKKFSTVVERAHLHILCCCCSTSGSSQAHLRIWDCCKPCQPM